MYFFPVVFFPFLNIYQFRNNPDLQSWLFSNLLISITVILVPLCLSLSMLITKFLGGVLKSMLTLNEAIIDVKEG